MATGQDKQRAEVKNQEGLHCYQNWEIDAAIAIFQEAIAADGDNPEYRLNLARAYARSSDYQQAISALGEYLRTETDETIAARYERMFSSALDEVESRMIEGMQQLGMTVQQVGKAIHMWLEYRITYGRHPLIINKPGIWSAALVYAIVKVNLLDMKRATIARAFKVEPEAVKKAYTEIVQTLDLMPGDFRYFAGEQSFGKAGGSSTGTGRVGSEVPGR
ncbi:MAG: tetratricopeptide repeat protein [Ardenticatenaceae bacterium]|nr:tetratricopeptide repeat protein [Ardenticatenaceae bacterium]